MTTPITDTPEWQALVAHAADVGDRHLRDLFADDPGRAGALTFDVADVHVDLSKHRVTPETLRLLVDLAERAGLRERIDAMFAGERVNTTEDRAVLHVALRAPRTERIVTDGVDVVPEVHEVLDRMAACAEQIRSGAWLGATGRPIRNVVNIGIGGSDLGPAMAYDALRAYADRSLTMRFVSNVDGADVLEATRDLDPAETLFVVCSKTFSTLETLTNAETARDWIVRHLGDDPATVGHHFVAVSTNAERVTAFGCDVRNMFELWDWVGGRYSLDSAIGLSLMIAIGSARFAELLDGFHAVDRHLRETPFERNVPVLMGLLGVWYRDFLHAATHAVVPYSHYLARFPAYLQQLEMESNGKSVRRDGTPVTAGTGAVVWGAPGTNGQHAFFQLLHQGTELVPLDLVGFVDPIEEVGIHQHLLTANLLAQAEALAFGRTAEAVAADGVPAAEVPHRTFPGNRPSTVLLAPKLTPRVLGSLVALYEHKVLTQGVIWDIDSFDQWGVELGKRLAGTLADELRAPDAPTDAAPDGAHDASTAGLLAWVRGSRRNG